MANISLRSSATWTLTLLERFDAALDLLDLAVRTLRTDKRDDFHRAAHAARVRRLAAHGCSGQALI